MKTNKENDIDFQKVMAFLETNNEKAIEELRKENPFYEQIFSSGELLNEDDNYEVNEELIGLKKAQLKGIEKTLPELIKKADYKITQLRNTLKKLRRYQFISKLVTLVSGSVILATLVIVYAQQSASNTGEMTEVVQTFSYNYLDFIAPSLVLLSSILNLYYDYKIEDFLGGNKQEQVKRLIENRSQAKTLLLYDITPLKQHFIYQLSDTIITKAAAITSELEKIA
jgi:hypothetical protein